MKVLLLANADSIHTQRWAKSLSDQGIEIGIFSLKKTNKKNFEGYSQIPIWSLEDDFDFSKRDGHFSKLKYLKALPALKKAIKLFRPDILHSYYATSYGLIGALSGFRPFYLSVWGSDIYIFPHKGFLQRCLLTWVLGQADKIFSTSNDMAKRTMAFTDKKIHVIPFGVPAEKFKSEREIFSNDIITIGTSKRLEKIYGIDILIKAFYQLQHELPHKNLRLLLLNEGSQKKDYLNLIQRLGIQSQVELRNEITYSNMGKFYNEMDIVAFPSRSESFGVSAIEALLCQRHVVANNVGGLKEVFDNGKIPYLAELTPASLAKILRNLILTQPKPAELTKEFFSKYTWQHNVKDQKSFYLL